MAKVITSNGTFPSKLRSVLKSGLASAGINVQRIETERISGTKLHRVTVLSKGFEKLRPSERHDLVWRIVGGAIVNHDEQLQIRFNLHLCAQRVSGRTAKICLVSFKYVRRPLPLALQHIHSAIFLENHPFRPK